VSDDLAYPLRYNPATGDLVTVTTDSAVEIGQCVQKIADTPRGTEKARPQFGRPELAFVQGSDGMQTAADLLYAAIDDQEKRAQGAYRIESEGPVGHAGKLTVDVRGMADSTPSEDAL
jgi:hypothetical protein